MLELVLDRPDWLNALGVALTRPPGVPERRAGQDPWNPASDGEQKRPRRIADDLAWLRQAYDEPEENGLMPAQGHRRRRGLGAPTRRARERLFRLRERRVLDAAGFLLHTSDDDDSRRR